MLYFKKLTPTLLSLAHTLSLSHFPIHPIFIPFFQAHLNFLAVDSQRGPIAISLISDGESHKCLIRTTAGSERLSVSCSAVPVSWWRSLVGFGPTTIDIFNAISRNIPVVSVKMCKEPSLPNELLAMEERQVIRSYKFGVTYLASGQTTEEQMFANKLGKY